ncbi:MAG: hypothetical protein QN229_01295 [Desulfurococcaceae archaeon TW002]
MVGHKINLKELKRIAPGLLPVLNIMSRMTYGKDLETIITETNNGTAEEIITSLLFKIFQNEETPKLILNIIKN